MWERLKCSKNLPLFPMTICWDADPNLTDLLILSGGKGWNFWSLQRVSLGPNRIREPTPERRTNNCQSKSTT
jgi:hypothetical protein